jgi:hypothetical protein
VRVAIGRRVASPEDLERDGDYCGPIAELDGLELEPSGRMVVVLLSPDGTGPARLASPPWVFREMADGTLEIREGAQA